MPSGLVDLHAHILPGLDDGPAEMSESLALLRALSNDGVTHVVAAVHGFDGRHSATAAAILERLDELREAAGAAGLGTMLTACTEAQLGMEALRAAESGDVLCLGDGRHLVIDLAPDGAPQYWERALFELELSGYQPILNHPERHRVFQSHPALLRRFVERGVQVMVTAGSLLGHHGPLAKKAVASWLNDGIDLAIVSDTHGIDKRPPVLTRALSESARLGKQAQDYEWGLTVSATIRFS